MRMSALSIVRRSDPDDALLLLALLAGAIVRQRRERTLEQERLLSELHRRRRPVPAAAHQGHERLDEAGDAKLTTLLEAGDPHGEVHITWHARETIRSLCAIDDPDQAATFIDELVDNMADRVLNAWAAVYRAAVEPAR